MGKRNTWIIILTFVTILLIALLAYKISTSNDLPQDKTVSPVSPKVQTIPANSY